MKACGGDRREGGEVEFAARVTAESDVKVREHADEDDGDHAADEGGEVRGEVGDADGREFGRPDREEDEEPRAQEVAPAHEERGRDDGDDVCGCKEHDLCSEAGGSEVTVVQGRIQAGEAEPDREPDGPVPACNRGVHA